MKKSSQKTFNCHLKIVYTLISLQLLTFVSLYISHYYGVEYVSKSDLQRFCLTLDAVSRNNSRTKPEKGEKDDRGTMEDLGHLPLRGRLSEITNLKVFNTREIRYYKQEVRKLKERLTKLEKIRERGFRKRRSLSGSEDDCKIILREEWTEEHGTHIQTGNYCIQRSSIEKIVRELIVSIPQSSPGDAVGEKGQKGEPGNRGEKGIDGIPGEKGTEGIPGQNGEQGPRGLKGDRGERGLPGKDGTKGANGKEGIHGIKGEKGEPGISGKDGIPGEKGTKGDRGETGFPGKDGIPGAKGKDGIPGIKGERGERGIPAKVGIQEEKGTEGIPGRDVEPSPIGPSGPQGSPGVKGEKGEPGCPEIKGTSGITGPTDLIEEEHFTTCGIRKIIIENNKKDLGRAEGGRKAANPWPWMVAVNLVDDSSFNVSKHHCGGSLIHKSWVLSAANCFLFRRKDLIPKERIIVNLGLLNVNNRSNLQQISVENYIIHPDYNKTTHHFDIALIQLSREAEFNMFVRPICLAPMDSQLPENSKFYREGERAVAIGWGYDKPVVKGTEIPRPLSHLKEVHLPIQNDTTCNNSLNGKYEFTETMFCAGEGENDTCKGDGGGPLMQPTINEFGQRYWTQVGIISWGVGCGQKGRYGFYTHVARLREWIDSTIQ